MSLTPAGGRGCPPCPGGSSWAEARTQLHPSHHPAAVPFHHSSCTPRPVPLADVAGWSQSPTASLGSGHGCVGACACAVCVQGCRCAWVSVHSPPLQAEPWWPWWPVTYARLLPTSASRSGWEDMRSWAPQWDQDTCSSGPRYGVPTSSRAGSGNHGGWPDTERTFKKIERI